MDCMFEWQKWHAPRVEAVALSDARALLRPAPPLTALLAKNVTWTSVQPWASACDVMCVRGRRTVASKQRAELSSGIRDAQKPRRCV